MNSNEAIKDITIIQNIESKYNLQSEIVHTNKIRESIENFKLKILLVGSFSAGKSALMNAMLEDELLKEDQKPETAIACELIYDENQYIEAVYGESRDNYEVTEFDNIDVDKCDYLIYHIKNDFLEKMKEYVFVDMPGFNSGIKNHNKAILQYANKANAYLLVIDCEEGGIKQSMNQFLQEIKSYDDNLAIVISKSDLKIPEEINNIKEIVKETAEDIFGYEINVDNTSKFDSNAKDKIAKLVSKFNIQDIFSQEIKPVMYDASIRCIESLECLKKAEKLDISDFKMEIEKRENAKKQLSNKLQNEKQKLSKNFKDKIHPSIIADINNALYQQADVLVRSLKAGGSDFTRIVNNILRPVLVQSTQTYVENSYDDFISEINFDEISNNDTDAFCGNLLSKYKDANSKIKDIAKYTEEFNGLYKAVTTALAVTTSVVAPWLELVMIFLPDVIKLFGNISSNNQDNQIKNKVINTIIPEITRRLEPEIEKSLVSMQNEMVKQIEERINHMIDIETEALEKALELKSEQEAEYEEKIKDIDKNIDMVKNIIKLM